MLRLISSDLPTLHEVLEKAQGRLSQLERAEAHGNANNYLLSIGLITSAEQGMRLLDANVVELTNCCACQENSPWHIELCLRIYALVRWLIDTGEPFIKLFIIDIADTRKCDTVRTVLLSKSIP